MSLLTDREKKSIENDVGELIHADDSVCRVIRPAKEGEGDFYGSHETSETVITEELSIEFLPGTPEGLEQEGADASTNVDYDADVQEGDFLVVEEVRYRVSHVDPHTAFGAQSHKTLILEREYKENE